MSIEERIEKLESDVKVIARVAASTADDTLRVCFLLQELEDGGYLPTLPWALATAIVDLHHLQEAKKHSGAPTNGLPLDASIAELERRIATLREEFRKMADDQARG